MRHMDLTEKLLTVVVDMLNYGSAAQTYFGYKADNLANAGLSEALQAKATGDVICEKETEVVLGYAGTVVSLEQQIVLKMYFNAVSGHALEDLYAEVEFTNYRNTAVTATIPGSEFTKNGNYWIVPVDEMVLSDAFELLTVSIYDKNDPETALAIGRDNLESNVARNTTVKVQPVYDAIMKFATSAKAYLLK